MTLHCRFGLLPLTKACPPFPPHPHLGQPLERQLMSMAPYHLPGIIVGERLRFACEGGGGGPGAWEAATVAAAAPSEVATSPTGFSCCPPIRRAVGLETRQSCGECEGLQVRRM